ncbi:MAG: SMP-30/gluconolactonase/LRE family protein [Sorangiineae bacterium]|nr:SMP-30/gluconolactonase/LRE family protein [Polyangiaceae bacterium]MEB2323103.1 SMP-30/gluconolactonase/LRE family protein [Sorangiineae bacterium]
MRTVLAVWVAAAALVGCGAPESGGRASGGASGTSGMGGAAGAGAGGEGSGGAAGDDGGLAPAQVFATLSAPAGGLAFGEDAAATPVLFVSVPSTDSVMRVSATGAVELLATIPSPTGIARTAAGRLLVCGQGPAGDQGVVYEVDPATGDATPLVTDATTLAGKRLSAIAVAPDDRVLFSDDGSTVYRADADGRNLSIATATVGKPTALAFSADGGTLYAAASTDGSLWKIIRNRTLGNYTTPTRIASGLAGVAGMVVLESGELIVIGAEVTRLAGDGSSPTTLLGPAALTTPAGAAAGVGPFGATWLYAGEAGAVVRLSLPGTALTLPVR